MYGKIYLTVMLFFISLMVMPQSTVKVPMKMTLTPEGRTDSDDIEENNQVKPVSLSNTPSMPVILKFWEDFHLAEGQLVDSMTVLFGNATIEGHVNGHVTVFRGNIDIGKSASVEGTVKAIFGRIRGTDEGDDWKRTLQRNNYQEIGIWKFMIYHVIPLIWDPFLDLQERWGLSGNWHLFWQMSILLTMALTYAGIGTIFSQQAQHMARIIVRRPFGSAAISMVTAVVIPYLIMFGILSIVGIPLVLVIISGLLVMSIYGKTAIFLSIGNAIWPQQKVQAINIIIGYGIYLLAVRIPSFYHLGEITFAVASVIGIALCIRSVFGNSLTENTKNHTLSQVKRPIPVTWQ